MPVVVRGSGQKGEPKEAGGAPGSGVRAPVPTPVFVAAIVLVVLIVAVIAYRLFGPQDGGWDNTREGTPPSASSLMAPPPVPKSGGEPGKPGAPGAQDPSQADIGKELPPDVR